MSIEWIEKLKQETIIIRHDLMNDISFSRYRLYLYTIHDPEYIDKINKYQHVRKKFDTLYAVDTADKIVHVFLNNLKSLRNVTGLMADLNLCSPIDIEILGIKLNSICSDLEFDKRNLFQKYNIIFSGLFNIQFPHINIKPNKYIYANEVYDITTHKCVILEILLHRDIYNRISDVKVKATKPHPNCDSNGYFCLGDLKGHKVSEDSINLLMHYLKTYKLDDSYWDSNKIKTFLKENNYPWLQN